ncbi:hypothetical protein P152DRAFT_488705 [Eremomyces bilateralis CBS 781.70]|uniref:Uncharacterized protein n=1 Tax=Eremomyces bilateralis CBS 781.70 TaxID=1392243 RepID=A0A6G1G0W4_9PEZI|nr:uncharacterized protein P152DRAFT_488705 [Eremomyces bilateralis CBS 781.70]KAF1811694.1 hypothetical protein P152DRAFT_488705 [Eremomyces bilateralis CBS 781.70]
MRDLFYVDIDLKWTKGIKRHGNRNIFILTKSAVPMLCPVLHILALAIIDGALEVEPFSDSAAAPRRLFRTRVGNVVETRTIHIKDLCREWPIFRAPEDDVLPLSRGAYNGQQQRLGLHAGYPQLLRSYDFRRGAGEVVNMTHLRTRRDPRAPARLSANAKLEVKETPEFREKCRVRDRFCTEIRKTYGTILNAKATNPDKPLLKQYSEALKTVNSLRQKLEREALNALRANYFRNRDTVEINAEFQGGPREQQEEFSTKDAPTGHPQVIATGKLIIKGFSHPEISGDIQTGERIHVLE